MIPKENSAILPLLALFQAQLFGIMDTNDLTKCIGNRCLSETRKDSDHDLLRDPYCPPDIIVLLFANPVLEFTVAK